MAKKDEQKAMQDAAQASDEQHEMNAEMTAAAVKANDRNLSVKERLEAQPRVRVRIPVPQGMDPDKARKLLVPVQINGYTFQINRGEWVEVPQEVANILSEANYI